MTEKEQIFTKEQLEQFELLKTTTREVIDSIRETHSITWTSTITYHNLTQISYILERLTQEGFDISDE